MAINIGIAIMKLRGVGIVIEVAVDSEVFL
jgi:hypothetical protein